MLELLTNVQYNLVDHPSEVFQKLIISSFYRCPETAGFFSPTEKLVFESFG